MRLSAPLYKVALADQFPIYAIVEDRDRSGILVSSMKSLSSLFLVLFAKV
jgi:hypothetical protein